MADSKKEINVACNYLLRLVKAHVALSNEQITLFKRVFHDVLSKRFVDHWFPAAPHRGSAYRCLQTKHWKDPVLRSIVERSRIPLHRYLPSVFTLWIDPGEVAVRFGDEGTWCPLYKHETNGHVHQEYSDGEETASSLSSDDDLLSLSQDVEKLNVQAVSNPLATTDSCHSRSSSSLASSSRASSPYFTTVSTNAKAPALPTHSDSAYSTSAWNDSPSTCWPQHDLAALSDSLLSCPDF